MALIRVKRRVDEDPLEAFVLNSKRRKEEATADKDEVSTVLKFAGTVQNQRESLSQATKLTKDEARAIVSRGRREPQDDMRQKKRQEHRQNAQNERFRIVNCSRTIAETDGTESAPGDAAKEITILDIEKQSSDSRLEEETNSEKQITNEQRTSQSAAAGSSQVAVNPLVVEEEQGYVYDLYVPDVGQPELEWSEQFLENMLRVQPYDLMFDCYRDQKNMDFSDGDSDDSNEENYYRNDYPDSDDESTGERAMRRAMDSMQIAGEMGGESSDEEDFYEGPSNGQKEEYVHTLDVDEPGFRGDVDFQDTADRYGVAYAKFKKKVLKAFADASEVPTDGEEDDDDERSSTDRSWRGSDDEDCYSENEMDKFA